MEISRPTVVAGLLWAVVLIIYLPQAGHGFIQDDFRWIVESRVEALHEVPRLFVANVGFYRPLVSLSFAADYAVWGPYAFGYALTNLALCLLASMLLYMLARRFGLTAGASVVAMAVWLFNFHGINMALLWLSGRTALLAAVFSLLCAHAVLRGHYLVGGVLTLAAALSKEEAVIVPLLFGIFLVTSERRLGAAVKTMPMWAGVAIYLLLRSQSGAFWPASAPSYYRLSFAPGLLLRNVGEYADRSATVAVVAVLTFALASRVRPSDFTAADRRTLMFGAIWLPSMFALTVFLPVRSSLYALLPSIASALIAGVVSAVAQRKNRPRFARAAVAMTTAIILLIPVYRSRNARWVQPAELSQQVMTTLVRDLGDKTPAHVVLIDDATERFNLATAFGSLFREALVLNLGAGWTGDIAATHTEVAGGDHLYRLVDGNLRRER